MAALHPTAILGLDRGGTLLFEWSEPIFDQRLGSGAVGVLADICGQLFRGTHPTAPEPLAQRLFRGEPHRGVYPVALSSGCFRVDLRFSPLRRKGGEVHSVLVVACDAARLAHHGALLEQRQFTGESTLDASPPNLPVERLLDAVMEGASDAILVHDEDAVLFANDATRALFGGIPPEAILGRPLRALVPEEHRPRLADRIRTLLAYGGEDLHEECFPGAVSPWCSVNGLAIGEVRCRRVYLDGRPAVLSVVRDVTQRKADEEARRRLEAQLQATQKQESLGILAAGIAHDFNNLLMSMLGDASLLKRELAREPNLRQRVERIEKVALRAAELTRQLRAYSGGEVIAPEDVSVAELVEDMGDLLSASVSKNIDLVFDLEPALPLLHVDSTQIRQIVMNLIMNASEAIGSRSGTILVRARIEELRGLSTQDTVLHGPLLEGQYVSIEVSDDGCGMDPRTMSRVFDPFYSTKRAGRGLGLAAALGIVRGHQGGMRVTSEEGRGSTFQILLPPSVHPARPSEVRVHPVPDSVRGSGRVLVVEDEEGVRSTLRMALEYAGFVVTTAVDGREALDAFAACNGRVDAVLLDLTMPRMSGGETLRHLRLIRRDVPVILTSGFGEQESYDRLGTVPPDDFIQKPYQPDQLIAKLSKLIDERRHVHAGRG